MKKVKPIAWVILCLPVLYAAIAAAAAYKQDTNLFDLMTRFSHVLKHPTLLHWTGYTPQCIIGALACYGLAVTLYYSGYENRRPGEEYGSAKWGSVRALNKKYADPKGKNAILTKRISIGLDGYRHQRNLNILVVGGSGSGKTRYFCKPGIMSANCSYLVIDPKGEMLRSTGRLLEQEKYDIKVFDLIHPQQSDGYNPFTYIRDEPDVLKLMDNLVKNTTPPKGASNDPFWEKAEIALDSALMLYLLSEAPKEEQNFEMLMFMLECARVMEEDEQYQSPLDLLFQALEEREPNHVAVREYKVYKQAAGDFRARIAANSGRFPHPAAMDEGVAAMLPELVWTLTPLELAQLAAQVIANAPASEVSIHQLHVPLVDLRAQSLVVRDRLIAALESKGDQSISFSELTRDCTSRIEVVARFMAVLVFFKQGVLQYQQDGPFAELHLRWVPGVAETMSDVNISEGDFA